MIRSITWPLFSRALRLAFPVAGAYLVIVLGLMVEFMIVGRELGGTAVAAVGLAGNFSLVLVLAFHALEIAAQAIIARRYGEGNLRQAGVCFNNSVVLAFGVGIPLTVVLYFVAPLLFRTAHNSVIEGLAVEYFHHRLPSIPFIIAILVFIGYFNAISRPVIPMLLYGVTLLLNAVLCYGLVAGRFGLPNLGVAGAGLAQTISSIFGFCCFLAVLARPQYRVTYQLFKFVRSWSAPVFKSVALLAAPVFVQQFFGNFGMFLFSLINARVPDGGVSLSAVTIARLIAYLTYLPSVGFGIAAATMVGQYLGAEKPREAQQSGYVCWLIGAVIMTAGGIFFVLFRHPLIKLFISASDTEMVAQTAADNYQSVAMVVTMLLIIIAIYQPLEAVNTIIGKALQGAGDTFFVMWVSVLGQWGIFLPLAYFLAIPMELGAFGTIYAFAVQLCIISLIFMFRYRGEAWRKKKL